MELLGAVWVQVFFITWFGGYLLVQVVPLVRNKILRFNISSHKILNFGRIWGYLGQLNMLLWSLYYIESAIWGIIGYWESPDALVVKNVPANAGDKGDMDLIPGSGRSPGEGLGIPLQHSCWLIPWTEEPGRLQSMRSHRVEHNWSTWLSMHTHTGRKNTCLPISSSFPRAKLILFLISSLEADCIVSLVLPKSDFLYSDIFL